MTEIHEYNMALMSVNRKVEAVPTSIVVSLGTGLPPTTELKEIDVFRPDSIWDTAKLAYGISAIGNLLVDQATVSGLAGLRLSVAQFVLCNHSWLMDESLTAHAPGAR
jgi:energy-converting hydrogenase Eha subunit A